MEKTMKISNNILNNMHQKNATRKALIDCQERLQALIQRVRAMQEESHHLTFDGKNNIADQIRDTTAEDMDLGLNTKSYADNFCTGESHRSSKKFLAEKMVESFEKSIIIASKLPNFRASSTLLKTWRNSGIKFVDTKT